MDVPTLSATVAVLALLVAGLGLWTIALQRSHRALLRRLRSVLAADGVVALDEVLDRGQRSVQELSGRLDRLEQALRGLEAVSGSTLQRVGVVRFNPFPDTGGDQSFAIALLDGQGSGVVLSSLHGRADTRVFAKQVSAGRSGHPLSDEEQEAIRRAGGAGGA
jgi:hypothetical protein